MNTSYTLPNTCPRCGSVVFVRVGINRWRCVVCGYEVVLGLHRPHQNK